MTRRDQWFVSQCDLTVLYKLQSAVHASRLDCLFATRVTYIYCNAVQGNELDTRRPPRAFAASTLWVPCDEAGCSAPSISVILRYLVSPSR